MKTKTIVLSLWATIICSGSLISQNMPNEPAYYNWFDSKVQRYNTGLFNGIQYTEQYRTINEKHKFFEKSEFQLGSVVYNGQFYDQTPLKYNLDTDQLLLNIGYNYKFPTLILLKSKVEGFRIGESHFVHIENKSDETEMEGFYQVLVANDSVRLLKKNSKKRFKRIKGSTIYYEFLPENNYVIDYGDSYYNIARKKDVIRIWPNKRDFINENYNPALRKINEDDFWTSFFSKLSDSFNTQNIGKE